MPKKKGRKSASAAEKNAEIAEEEGEEGVEEVDGKKYGRRQIRSNWERYRPEAFEVAEEENSGKADDFAALLSAPADCNYFQFKSEKDWEREAAQSTFGDHKLFNLDLEMLSHGLATIPFYELVDFDRSVLSESDIEMCDRRAAERANKFKRIRERFLKKLEMENELPCVDADLVTVDKNVARGESRTKIDESYVKVPPMSESNSQFSVRKDNSKNEVKKSDNASPGGEDLEDWLDSVLDD